MLRTTGINLTRRTCLITSIVILCFFFLFGFIFSATSPPVTLIIIPGGGLTKTGEIPPHTQLRLNRAAEIYRLSGSNNYKIVTLSGGTPHKPNPLDADGFPIFEASAASKKLVEMGIPPENVWEENFSLDTIGNAYFLRTVHVEPLDHVRKIVVITNAWHMDRTRAMFDYIFSLPAHHIMNVRDRAFHMHYETVGDALPADVLVSRRQREAASLVAFNEKTKKQFQCMFELHQWLFTQHGAYASSRHTKPRAKVDKAVLESY